MTNEEIITILESYKSTEDQRTEDLLHHGYDNTKEATKRKEALDEAIKIISVPEREKGEWILVVDSYYEDGTIKENHWECSKCGSGKSGWGEYKFCPNCGADMRGKAE